VGESRGQEGRWLGLQPPLIRSRGSPPPLFPPLAPPHKWPTCEWLIPRVRVRVRVNLGVAHPEGAAHRDEEHGHAEADEHSKGLLHFAYHWGIFGNGRGGGMPRACRPSTQIRAFRGTEVTASPSPSPCPSPWASPSSSLPCPESPVPEPPSRAFQMLEDHPRGEHPGELGAEHQAHPETSPHVVLDPSTPGRGGGVRGGGGRVGWA
jgi:hypothetical protein